MLLLSTTRCRGHLSQVNTPVPYIPNREGFINDFAGILDVTLSDELELLSKKTHRLHHVSLVVATFPHPDALVQELRSRSGRPIPRALLSENMSDPDQFGDDLFTGWKLRTRPSALLLYIQPANSIQYHHRSFSTPKKLGIEIMRGLIRTKARPALNDLANPAKAIAETHRAAAAWITGKVWSDEDLREQEDLGQILRDAEIDVEPYGGAYILVPGFPFWPSRHGQGTPIRGSDARPWFSSHGRCPVRPRFGR